VALTSSKSTNMISRDASIRTPLYRLWIDVLSDPMGRGQQRGKTWDKAIWLLLAAYQNMVSPQSDFSDKGVVVEPRDAVHASIHLDVYLPEPVLSLVLSAYPEQLSIPNALGQLPLSAAVALRMVPAVHRTEWARGRCQAMVQLLLRAYKKAASQVNTNTGRSALMEAIGAGHSWLGTGPTAKTITRGAAGQSVLQQLLEAAPDMLQARDGTTGLPPVLLAAAVAANGPLMVDGGQLPAEEPSLAVQLDPYELLSTKQRDELLATPASILAEATDQKKSLGTGEREHERLTTIFALLRANPSQLVASP
jgi:hypothetical protein